MSDKNDFFGLIKENWGKLVVLGGIIAGVINFIPVFQANPELYIAVTLGVIAVVGLLACIFYTFLWKPEIDDGNSGLIIPGSDNLISSQGKKVKQRKIVRQIARLGLIVIPLLLAGGIWFSYYQAQLPPTDFRIVVADFERSKSDEKYDVTGNIFSNLEQEMDQYEDVKVIRLEETLGSIQAAKEEGKEHKAAIVIWGGYNVLPDSVPIRVNFEILKSTDSSNLGESVRKGTQLAELAELNSFNLQTKLSEEMTYLSLFTLGMYRYLDEDWEQAIASYKRALEVSLATNEPIASLGKEVVNLYLGNAHYRSKLYDESLKSYDKAIEIKPDLHEAWSNRGVASGKLGEYEKALASYDKAIEIKPDLHEAWYNRGNALDELGEYEKAIASYDKAIEIKPDLHEAWSNRGCQYALLNDINSAIKNLEQAFSLNPELKEYAKTDSELDLIRTDKRFKDLVNSK